MVFSENSHLKFTSDSCISISLFNMHYGLTHISADEREAKVL